MCIHTYTRNLATHSSLHLLLQHLVASLPPSRPLSTDIFHQTATKRALEEFRLVRFFPPVCFTLISRGWGYLFDSQVSLFLRARARAREREKEMYKVKVTSSRQEDACLNAIIL